jgi:hypothetical protein
MISCYCPYCYKEVEFLSTQAGFTAPCPACGKNVTVPGTPQSRPAATPPPPPPPPRPSGAHIHAQSRVKIKPVAPPDDPDAKIRCRCPHCNRILRVPPALAGQVSACPGCGGQFTVPDAPPEPANQAFEEVEEAEEADTSAADEPKIRCRCPHCNRILRVPQALAGQISTCPGCGGQFTVPQQMAEAASKPAAWEPEERPKRKRRRRRRYYDDDYSTRGGSYERGRVFALVIGILLILATLANVFMLLIMGAGIAKLGQNADPGFVAGFMCGAIGAIVLRLVGAIGLMAGQNWARVLLGVFLILIGLCSILAVVRGNVFALIDVVFNFGIGITVLVSPSIAEYTQN